MTYRVLLLAGTAEARAISRGMAAAGVQAIASLAGSTRDPAPLGVPTRVGGFGGADALEVFLDAERLDAIVDATHPFAEVMPRRAACVAAASGRPYLRVLRRGWTAGRNDRWSHVAAAEAVAGAVPAGARIFLATGPSRLDRLAGLAGRPILCRRIEATAAPFPWPGGRWVVGRPPFTVEAESHLFVRHGIDWLVTKNSGGAAGSAKLTAARLLGLGVVMIDRPPPPSDVAVVEDAAAAVDWVRRQACASA